jgi:hypothetical protein
MVCQDSTFYVPEKKCLTYIQNRLRAPPSHLVFQWGKQLKLTPQEIQTVNESLPLRYRLGIEYTLYIYFCKGWGYKNFLKFDFILRSRSGLSLQYISMEINHSCFF